jgi:transcriptional regulator, merR family
MDFAIKDAARMVGLTPRTLRYYESIGLLPKAERTSGNYRLFTIMDIIDLIRIKRLTGLGFDLQHVRQIIDDPAGPEALAALDEQRQLLTQRIDELQAKRAKIEEIQNNQAPLDVAIEFADLVHTWTETHHKLDDENRLKLRLELLAAFADERDQLKCETLIRNSVEKQDDPSFRELRELDARLEALDPDASPEEIAELVDDYVRVLGPILTGFPQVSEKVSELNSAMEEFTYNEAQLTVITAARERLKPPDDEP